ncbi:AAA family ATPase [Desulfitobacterium hafniense]|uniref:AAA family ATPase n=1 Tax=Desulfitobacterium hafniense TaxID=49338 RepID=UPI000378E639|nr:AAA family ATPase [Desulfitobacterium hafniense]
MNFKMIKNESEIKDMDTVYMKYIHYDDYGYCTSFKAYYIGSLSDFKIEELGFVKIGHISLEKYVEPGKSQNGYNSYSIIDLMPIGSFNELTDTFFSLGEDISYYKNITELFGEYLWEYCENLRDLAYDFEKFKELYIKRELCLINSLMRSLHYPNIEQFNRIVNGEAELTDYNVIFNYGEQEISVNVIPNSLPPSNIHVLIGRNGVGKTWILYHMMHAILSNMNLDLNNCYSNKYSLNDKFEILSNSNAFAGAIGVSFSVFDDAFSSITFDQSTELNIDILKLPQRNQIKDDFDKKYKYIGLIHKNQKDGRTKVKSVENLAEEFEVVINKIKKSNEKRKSYLEMCEQLMTDPMFSDNGFIVLLNDFCINMEKSELVIKQFKRLSSGHMIIILSLTLLCESVFEKTIVLIDEPETHLHPPLLSTYVRTLSFLLRKKNAVAIIATHSPIVVQEVPRSCVTKIDRNQADMYFSRPDIESFAANTDSLTRDIFGYEVMKTGFYKLLENEIEDSFEKTFNKFDEQIGFLGQIMIQRLIKKRSDNQGEEN